MRLFCFSLIMLATIQLGVLAGPALGADEACELLGKEVEDELKRVALAEAESIPDGSVPRLTMRGLEMLILWQKIDLAYRFMESHGCTMPTSIPRSNVYLLDAMKCRTAILKLHISGGEEVPSECDRGKWKPMFQEEEGAENGAE